MDLATFGKIKSLFIIKKKRYFFITHSIEKYEIGDIVVIEEPETFEDYLIKEFKTSSEIKYVELSSDEYKFYSRMYCNRQRITKYENGIYNDLIKLKPGQKCQIMQDFHDYFVTILKIEERYDEIYLICKTQFELFLEIGFTTIEYVKILNDENARKIELNESIYQRHELPMRIFCDPIGRDIINPKTIKCIDTSESQSFNKWVVMYIMNRRIIIKLMWKGLVDQQMCFGCKLAHHWTHGTDGVFNNKKLFDCEEGRGILFPFTVDVKCCESNLHHKSLMPNEIIPEDLMCCVEHGDKSELMLLQYNETSIFGRTITNKNISWIGKINEQECIGVHCNKIHVNKYRKGNWVDKLQICSKDLDKLALIRIGDHHIDLVENIFVSNRNDISYWKTDESNETSDIGLLVEVKNYVGKVAFFVERFDFVGLILDDHQLKENYEFLENILFHRPFPVIIVKNDFVKPFSTELAFKHKSCLIDPSCIKYRSLLQPEKFHLNDIVQSSGHESITYYKIKDFWLLNGWKCLEITQAICLEERNLSEFLRQEDAHKIKEIKTEYHLETMIKPSSIATFEKFNVDSLKPNDKVEFKSRISDILFQGIVKMIAKVNEIPSAIVQLECGTEHISSCNQILLAILGKHFSRSIVVPIDLLKIIDDRLELFEQYFLDLFRNSNNVDLEIKIIKNLVKMNKNGLMKSIFECKDHPLDLYVHQYLLPELIEMENVPMINSLLKNCDLTSVHNVTFFYLAALAIKTGDDQLFETAMKNYQNKNSLLENGESFLTNLFTEQFSEEQIYKTISKNIFNLEMRNKNGQSPFMLACQMGMLSIVEKITPKSLSPLEKEMIIDTVTNIIETANKEKRDLDNFLRITRIVNKIEISQRSECSICLNNEVNVVFDCGHVCCDSCILNIFKCPFCDKIIGTAKKLYI